MKYILICLVLCSCTTHFKEDKEYSKKLMQECFESGGDEYHYGEDSGFYSVCVYKNNSCRLDK